MSDHTRETYRQMRSTPSPRQLRLFSFICFGVSWGLFVGATFDDVLFEFFVLILGALVLSGLYILFFGKS